MGILFENLFRHSQDMRPVLHGDISNAARALLFVPERQRQGLCLQLLEEAELADQFVSQTGRLHPEWGNGSLMSAARKRFLAPEPTFDNPDYCRCFKMVLTALIARSFTLTHS